MNNNQNLAVLQKTCTDILFEFDKVCRTHGLTYYLAYGTLLGAVRHQGFIPWDDDVDLWMPRKDMQFIIDNFDDLFKKPYIINHYQKPGFTTNSFVLRVCNPRVKIKRKVGGENRLFDSFISIFPICGLPKNLVRQRLFAIKANLLYIKLRFIRSTNNGYGEVHRSFTEKCGLFLNHLFNVGKGRSIVDAVMKIDKMLSKYPYDNTNKVGIHSFCYDPFIYDVSIFGTPAELLFDGRELYAPSDYDKILRICYGDYMKLPPIESQKPAHSVDIIIEND